MTSNRPEIYWKKQHQTTFEAPAKPKLQNLFAPASRPAFDHDDDPSYLLNTLYYTDAVSDEEPVFSPYLDAMKRKKWLFEAYQDYFAHTTFTSM